MRSITLVREKEFFSLAPLSIIDSENHVFLSSEEKFPFESFVNQTRMFLSRCCLLSVEHRKNIIEQTPLTPHLSFIRTGLDALTISHGNPLIIADYGSSYGRSTVQLMKFILDYLRAKKKLDRTTLVVHNDLPNNEWTRLFQLLNTDSSYFAVASGRSFYEPCLPMKSLTLGYSAASLHHLSRKPCVIREHCYVDYASKEEQRLFQEQAKIDWESFLRHRSNELHSGGVLLLSIPCRGESKENGFDHYFDILYQCAQTVSLFSTAELIELTLPFYLRSFEECVNEQLFARYSLQCLQAELISLKSWVFDEYQRGMINRRKLAQTITLLLQPGTTTALESVLEAHRRTPGQIKEITERFWSSVEKMIEDRPYHHIDHTYAVNLILKKK